MSTNKPALLEKIKECFKGIERPYGRDVEEDFFYEEADEESHPLKDFTHEFVEQYGGEGQGDEYYTVYKFTDKETQEVHFVRFYGYWVSYDGANYEGFSIVKPVEKVITVWEFV